MQIEATYDLVIEIVPGDTLEDSVLLLRSTDENGQDVVVVIMNDEVEPLRQALAEAAAKLQALGLPPGDTK